MTQDETLLLKQPTISTYYVAFLYAGELWVAGRDGSHALRLTAQKGRKLSPMFSPDGRWIAFSGDYDGNLSVYVISIEGGSPTRLTYHPYQDFVRGWTPDGKSVLFASSRESISTRVRQLFTVPLAGGLPASLPMHMAERGAYSSETNEDGSPRYLAYTAYAEAFWSWKRYRGGMTLPIWVMDLATYDHVEIPHENASDTFPCWLGKNVYFLSDRFGVMNIFRWDQASGKVEQVTFYEDFDVRSLTAGPGMLAYEQAGRLNTYDPEKKAAALLPITIAADLPFTRPHFVKAAPYIQKAGISPSGARIVLFARGEILTLPAKKGEARNLTHSPGSCERDPSWSPDGQSIAYFSDASGEYELVITDQKGSQKTSIPLGVNSFFYSPTWSPDSKKIAFTDKALNLYYIVLDTRAITRIDTDTYDHLLRSLNPKWSPDSQWVSYTRRLDNQIRAVFFYNLEEGKSYQVTDGMSDATDAVFSRDGKYLFFAASSNYGLNMGWDDMSSFERPVKRAIYALVLSKEDQSPVAPETDEEKGEEEKNETTEAKITEEKGGSEEKKDQAESSQDGKGEKPPVPVEVKIDLDGLGQRIVAMPVPACDYNDLQTAQDRLFYAHVLPGQFSSEQPHVNLMVYDLKERKEEVFKEDIQEYWVCADGKKLLYRLMGQPKFALVGVEKRPAPDEGMINLDALEVYVDPCAEWKQIFREAFRIHRDFFYDAHLHGLDLEAAYQKYLPFLQHVGHRDDLNYLLSEFSGELVVSHAYVGTGDIPEEAQVQVGMLGADYELTPEGFYRIKRIYAGQSWHPELGVPLMEPGVNVKEGEYLLGVNGRSLRFPTNLYSLFQKTADHVIDIRVSPTTDDKDARTVSVKPVASEAGLRHWAWVESNRKKVDELSNGRVAYVYMPDTGLGGYENFNRYYFSQLDKSGVVLDERFNGGGYIPDYVIDLLNRPILSYWATREGKPFATPNASIFGPKVMIINELAASGGDAMAYFFRRRGLGKLVGKRTWGGLIGIYDYPLLMDGGFFKSPRKAIFSPQGEWEVENEGVAPEIEVEMTPKLVIEGHDPQLERAVQVVLDELEQSPFVRAPRPAPALRAQMANLRQNKVLYRLNSYEKLAIQGGSKAVTNKLIGWPQFDDNAINSVVNVLRSGKVNYWTGRKGMEFEQRYAEWQGSQYAISTTNGTAALHVALNSLGIGPGDEVIVPSYTFIATSFSVVQAGAVPRFADVNIEDHCLSVESAETLVNERTKAIIPVHLYGNVCDMDKIRAFAQKYHLFVIEDNAQAFGGEYKGKKTGTLGDIAACSFCQNKTFTTGGEGGMVTTDNEELAWKARSFRDHGYDVKDRLNLLEMEQKLSYIHNMVGFNYRMTEMQSAIGLAELDRMDRWNMPNRRRNANILVSRLKQLPQVKYFPVDTAERRNGWYVMAFSLDIDQMKCDITEFVKAVAAENAPVWKVFWPQCHTERAYTEHVAFGNSGFPFASKEYTSPASLDYSKIEVPNARWHETHTFTCFGFPTYTESDMEQIADAIEKVIKAYAK